jgi:Zn-finger nucleic acid-binding protein
MNCPRCHSALQSKTYEAGVVVDECPDCRGFWLDRGELERIEETVEKNHSARLSRPENGVQAAFERARQQGRPDLNCPRCGRRMDKQECHHASGIIVDLCPACAGIWLDRGELESLEIFAERRRAEERAENQRGFFTGLRNLFGG